MIRVFILALLFPLLSPDYLQAQGLVKDTWSNGNVKSEGIQIDGVNHSIWVYHDEEGRLTATVHYDYGDDTLRTDYEYNTYGDLYLKSIKRQGVTRETWTNISPKKTKYESYHENSSVFLKGDLKDSLRIGKWMEYDDTGELQHKLEYKKGEIVTKTEVNRVFGVNANVKEVYLTTDMTSTHIPLYADTNGKRFEDLGSTEKFYSGELYLPSDTLQGYLALTKPWEVSIGDLGGTITTYQAKDVTGFKVDELTYKSIKHKGEFSVHPIVFFEVVDENWIYPIYARTVAETNVSSTPRISLPNAGAISYIPSVTHFRTKYRRYYFLALPDGHEIKLEKIYIEKPEGGKRSIMLSNDLADLLEETCPELASRIRERKKEYYTKEFFRYRNDCY